jgi:hypothetical protein
MGKYIIELDTTEIVRLMSACTSAIVSENRTLENLPYDSSSREVVRDVIAELELIKRKLRSAVL